MRLMQMGLVPERAEVLVDQVTDRRKRTRHLPGDKPMRGSPRLPPLPRMTGPGF